MRLTKYIQQSGVCSRRKAEELIASGAVSINDITVNSVTIPVNDGDVVKVDGKKIKLTTEDSCKLWAYYKPCGLITSHGDQYGRPTVFDDVKDILGINEHIISVGRLDINSEGLLLLTNNSALAHKLEQPQNGMKRVYKVRAYGQIDEKRLNAVRDGIMLDGIQYDKCVVNVTSDGGEYGNHWFTFEIYEGKNREVRKLLEYVGVQVNRLIRVSYGPYKLGDMKIGEIRIIES